MVTNLEQAAMTAASTGVTPKPTKAPKYEDKPADEWMSYLPESYAKLPDVIGEQRTLQAQQLREGAPEVVRKAAQPFTRRGLFGSGLQLENIGQAGLARQQAIQNAEMLAKIDPIKAQIAMGDMAQQRFTQRAQESRRRYEKEEAYTQQQRARDDLMRQQTGSSLLSMATQPGMVSDLLYGKQPTAMDKLLLANEPDATKRAALAKQMGIGQSSPVLSSILGDKVASDLANKGILGAVGGALFGSQGLLGGKIQEAGKVIRDTLTGGGDDTAIRPVNLDQDVDLVDPTIGSIESEAFKRAGPQVGGAGMITYDKEGNRVDALGNRIERFEEMSSNLENQARVRDAVFRPDQDPYELKNLGIDYPPPDPLTTGDVNPILSDLEEGGGAFLIDPQSGRTFTEGGTEVLGDPNIARRNLGLDPVPSMEGGGRLVTDAQGNSTWVTDPIKVAQDKIPITEQILPPTGDFIPDEALESMMASDYFEPTGVDEFAQDYIPSLGANIQNALKGISDVVPGNILDTGIGLAISSALNPEGFKGVASNPLSFIGPQIMAQSGAGPLAIGKALATQTLPTGAALSSALAGSVIGIPLALAGAGIASNRKARAQAEAEETRNRMGSADFNFVPGELQMIGQDTVDSEQLEANTNFRTIDALTGIDKIYEEDPRRAVMGGDSLSKRGQDFAMEMGVDYTNPDPDVQNTSQKWLGKQQVYSQLIPETKEIFRKALNQEISREEANVMVSEKVNKYFSDNPDIFRLHNQINRLNMLKEAQRGEEFPSDLEDSINDLMLTIEETKVGIPKEWSKIASVQPFDVPMTRGQQYEEALSLGYDFVDESGNYAYEQA